MKMQDALDFFFCVFFMKIKSSFLISAQAVENILNLNIKKVYPQVNQNL